MKMLAARVMDHRDLQLMADAVGAEQAFFSTCGSSLSVKAAMLAVAGRQGDLLISRDAHKSVVAALVFSGVQPQWIQPRYDTRLHVAQEAPARAKLPTTGAQRSRTVLCRACVEKLAAKLEKVTERLEADAPNMSWPGADLDRALPGPRPDCQVSWRHRRGADYSAPLRSRRPARLGLR